MVRFLMQQVDAETLLHIAFTVFRPKPSRVLRKLLGQRRDPLGYRDRVALPRCNSPEIVHVLVKTVGGTHGILLPGSRGVGGKISNRRGSVSGYRSDLRRVVLRPKRVLAPRWGPRPAVRGMPSGESASPQQTDINRREFRGRSVPEADICSEAKNPIIRSIGEREQLIGHG